ncbi:MAG TPA: ABC transporter permease [Candidatus Methylomirabilis sp.]|nr:ABC transporter permease [Candidatus Methylomirabilis sp.]
MSQTNAPQTPETGLGRISSPATGGDLLSGQPDPGPAVRSSGSMDHNRVNVEGALGPSPARSKRSWSRLRQFRRNRGGVAGFFVVVNFALVAILANEIVPFNPVEQNLSVALQGPGESHWLGTDELGRDILSRIIMGARVSLLMSVAAVIAASALGTLVGSAAGYFGGGLDHVAMRCIDVLLALPGILLAITIIAVLGVGLINVVVAIAISGVPVFARLARAVTLTVKENEYVQAARAMGAADGRILARHVLPNIVPPLLVQCTLLMATAILTASSLSFLGLGAQPPTPEWGAMLSSGRSYLTSSPHVGTFPGIALMLVVLGFNMLGDGLRDALDPRLKR